MSTSCGTTDLQIHHFKCKINEHYRLLLPFFFFLIYSDLIYSVNAVISSGSSIETPAAGTARGACFLREKPSEAPSVVCAIAVMDAAAVSVSLSMQPAKYGLVVPSGGKVEVLDLLTGAAIGTFAGNVTYTGSVPGYSVKVLKLSVSK